MTGRDASSERALEDDVVRLSVFGRERERLAVGTDELAPELVLVERVDERDRLTHRPR